MNLHNSPVLYEGNDATTEEENDDATEENDKAADNFEDWALIFEKRRCTSAHKSSHSSYYVRYVMIVSVDQIYVSWC